MNDTLAITELQYFLEMYKSEKMLEDLDNWFLDMTRFFVPHIYLMYENAELLKLISFAKDLGRLNDNSILCEM